MNNHQRQVPDLHGRHRRKRAQSDWRRARVLFIAHEFDLPFGSITLATPQGFFVLASHADASSGDTEFCSRCGSFTGDDGRTSRHDGPPWRDSEW